MPRERLPNRRPQFIIPMFYANREYHVALGFYDLAETKPAELFISSLKEDGTVGAIARDAAVATSIGIQFGVPLWLLHDALNKVENEGTMALPAAAGDAAGILGAALDAIRSERPDLFEVRELGIADYVHPAPGEPSFTLLGRDPQAPGLIELWADVRERLEPTGTKASGARAIATAMRAYKDANPDHGMPRQVDSIGMPTIDKIERALNLHDKWLGTLDCSEACSELGYDIHAAARALVPFGLYVFAKGHDGLDPNPCAYSAARTALMAAIGQHLSIPERQRLTSAVTTLERLGYGWNGGEEWGPPLGDPPDFEAQDRRQTLKNILTGMASVKDQINTLKDEVTTYNDVIDRQNKEIQELRQNKEIQELRQNNKFLEDEVAGLNTLLEVDENTIAGLNTLLEVDENTIAELRTELALLRQENDFLHDENGKLRDTITEQDDMLRGLRPAYQAHHVKRGTNYDVLSHTVRVQCETPLQDMEELMLYIGEDRHLSVRRADEFFDGRFITSIDNGSIPVAKDMPSILPLESRRWRQKAGLRIAHAIWGDCVYDVDERRRRMVEELFELIQASGITDIERDMIQRDVYSRPPGEIGQELGGASYTMMSFAEVSGLCLEDCETAEIERVRAKDPNEMRTKQNAKAARGVAIPGTEPAVLVLLPEHESIEDFMGGHHGR